MIFKTIEIGELLNENVLLKNAYVHIPFLYTPALLELKRIEKDISRLTLSINRALVKKDEVILSILRLFSLPLLFEERNNFCQLIYENLHITIEFINDGLLFSGVCYCHESKMLLREDSSFLRIENPSDKDSIIVLPEGDGKYYMNLDYSESSEAKRLSIIGNPDNLRKNLLWLMDQRCG